MPEIIIPYAPRPHQAQVHESLQRFNVLVCHRRFGKTVACVNELIFRALQDRKPEGRYAYIAPFYKQAKTVAWDYLKHYTDPIPGRRFNESELRVDFADQRIRLFGGDNPDALRGIYLDGVILDEYAEMDPRVWSEIIRPALSDRKGWAIFIGTPKGKNAFYDIYQHALKSDGWFGAMYRASDTGIVDAAELADARQVMTEDEYAQEYECSFDAAIKGAYYAREMHLATEGGRITSVPYQSEFPVDTWWDLGIDDSTAIWFVQYAGREIHLVDYYESNGEALAHYVDVIKERTRSHGCSVGEFILPHDVRQRELGTGVTRQETLENLGCKTTVAPNQSVIDGINAARQIMGRCWWDATRCERGIEALRQYRKDFDEINRAFRQKPLHDWSSHACFTGDTEVLTRNGMYRIMDLPETGEVLTPCGWRQYTNPRLTKRLAPLVAVTFADGYTVRCTPDHLFLTDSGWKSAEHLTTGTLIQSSLTRSRSISMAVSTAFGRVSGITRAAVRSCTAMFGSVLSGHCLPIAMSTTATATLPITASPIWSAWTPESIYLRLGKALADGTGKSISRRRRATRLLSGIARKLAAFGTGDMPNGPRAGRSGSGSLAPATSAARSLTRWFARAAIRNGSAPQTASPLIIAGVRPLPEREDVYDLTVPEGHWFSLANGAVVHNSDAFRYGAITKIGPKKERPKGSLAPKIAMV